MIVDGWIVPEDRRSRLPTGKQNAVDIIAGSNKDEHTSLGGNIAFRDTMMWAMRLFAERQTAIGKRAYWYLFTHEPPVEPGGKDLKATHATEIVYVFNNLWAPRVIPDVSSPKLAMESGAGSENGRRDVVLLGQLREKWRPEWTRPSQLAAIQVTGTHRRTSLARLRIILAQMC